MNRDNERMVEFRLKFREQPAAPDYMEQPGERCLMRISAMLCLFPEHHQIWTTVNRVVDVCDEDWEKVERDFRSAYLGGKVHAA